MKKLVIVLAIGLLGYAAQGQELGVRFGDVAGEMWRWMPFLRQARQAGYTPTLLLVMVV